MHVGEQRERIGSLDGLRGVAAVVVLIHHSLLVLPAVAAGDSSTTWLVRSPLHIFWAGNEAVYVFFILSGVVLTLPSLRRRLVWRSYYPSRLIRLYLPVIASVLLAVGAVLLVPRETMNSRSLWMQSHAEPLTISGVLKNATLLAPDWLNSPLWSLRWEMAFSLLLPIYVALTLLTRRFWWVTAIGAIALSAAGSFAGLAALTYLPMFLIGGSLAVAITDERVVVPKRWWPYLTVCCLLGITSTWWVPGALLSHLAVPLVVVSAVGLVLAAASWNVARRVLERPVVQWTGRVSFSLYLVHEPIIVTIGVLLPAGIAWAVPVIAIPIALVVAYAFFHFVEAPAHRVSKRVSKALHPAASATV
jgi:peptidoglycan/LPS O-acetylase OafA/YrhL